MDLSRRMPMSAANRRRLISRSALALPLAALLLAACAGQDDISRVQPDAIDKSFFLKADGTPHLFYYHKTITAVPPTNSYSFEKMINDMLKIRFDVQEKFLIGYRT